MKNTQVPAADLPAVLAAHYDLAEPVECEFMRRGFNDHYLVRTGAGRYVLRIYLNGKYYIDSAADFRFELDLLAFLHEHDIPVSHAIEGKDGDRLGSLETLDGSRSFALFTFAEGKKPETMEPGQGETLGRTVARFHQVADRFRTAHRRYHLNLEYLVERPMEEIDRFLRERGKGSVAAYLPLVEQLTRPIRKLPVEGDAYGIIHGDLHSGNLHLTDQGRPILFDFDHGGYGWRAYDVSVCQGGMAAEAKEAFLQGYQSIRRLSALELGGIPIFRKIRPIWDKGDVLAMRAAWKDEAFGDEFADGIVRMFETLFGPGAAPA